jgi:hypothetical protein
MEDKPMSKTDEELDRMIADALDAEDREIMHEFGEEQAYFTQALAIFRGKLAWVMWLANLMNILGAVVAGWAGWKLYHATDPVIAIQFGILALAGLNMGLFFKGAMGMHGETMRVVREIKRLELQVLRGQAKDSV